MTANAKWGAGPWDDEPDHVDFEAHGMPCIMHRHESTGHWCGYVAVPPGHPWHGRAQYAHEEAERIASLDNARVHGGVTYEGKCSGHICHVARPGEPDDVWWLGFDFNHCDDSSPFDLKWSPENGFRPSGVYRDAIYVRAETEQFAAQAQAAFIARGMSVPKGEP